MDVLKKAAIVALLLGCVVSSAQAASREYEIKAAFIYNFFHFIEWPSSRTTWTVGLLGDDPFEGCLREFESKPVGGKNIIVKFLKTPKEAKGCDVVYISGSESGQVGPVLSTLKGSPTLTISDMANFADKGGAIGFIKENNRVRFVVNTDTLKQAELRASAKFLQLASRTVSWTPEIEEQLLGDQGMPFAGLPLPAPELLGAR